MTTPTTHSDDNRPTTPQPRRASLPVRIFRFYRDGFRSMTVGRDLWLLIIIKLVLLFLVFKLFFFPNLLQRDYDTDDQRADAVRSSLIDRSR